VTTLQFWPAGAPTIARCHCGGDLKLVEDPGPKVPVEAQCVVCLELTGLPHGAVEETKITPGSPEDFGF